MTDEELDRELAKARRISELEGSLGEKPKAASSALPEWMSDALKYGPGFLAEQGKNAVRGAGKMVSTAATTLGRLSPLVPASLADAADRAFQGEIDRALPIDPNETEAQKRMRKVSESAGAGALGAPNAALIPAAATVGAMSGLGGELGGTVAEKSGIPRPIGEIAGGVLAGGATGFALGPRQNVAQADLRRAMNSSAEGAGGMDNLVQGAQGQIRKFDAANSKSASLVDAFPQDSAVVALGERARNSTLENPLRTQTQGRMDDIDAIIKGAIEAAGPRTGSPMERVIAIKEAAKQRLKDARARSNAPYDQLRDLSDIPDSVLMQKIVAMEQAAGKSGQTSADAGAMKAIIAALLDENNPTQRLRPGPKNTLNLVDEAGPQRRPEALSVNIAEFSTKDANLMAKPGAQISPRAEKGAQSAASAMVADLPAPWGPAYQDARARGSARREKLYEPLKEGPVGKLAGMNPNSTMEPGLGVLDNIWKGRDEAEILRIVKQLEKGAKGSTSGTARSIVENKASTTPTDKVPQAIRPQNDLPATNAFNKLIDRTGGDSKKFNTNLDVAEELARRGTSSNISEPPTMGLSQLIRPFRTIDMALSGKREKDIQNEIAALLADRSKLAELQKIAMFDPNARRILSLITPLMGQMGSSSQEK